MNPTTKKNNMQLLQKDLKCLHLIDELKTIEGLISGFGYLTHGRDYVLCDNYYFSLQTIITSIELTTGNIISCCESACIADANTLLQKFRDDLFFYLYIEVFNTHKLLNNFPDHFKTMQINICRWHNNELDDLYIDQIMKSINSLPKLGSVIKKYDLKTSFDKIKTQLNNYVHSNGINYYNNNINSYKTNELNDYLEKLVIAMKYITMSFLLLLMFCSPISVMSLDHIIFADYCNFEYEHLQFSPPLFVEKFIKNNIELIDKNCYNYLKQETAIQFNSFE